MRFFLKFSSGFRRIVSYIFYEIILIFSKKDSSSKKNVTLSDLQMDYYACLPENAPLKVYFWSNTLENLRKPSSDTSWQVQNILLKKYFFFEMKNIFENFHFLKKYFLKKILTEKIFFLRVQLLRKIFFQ